jgi:hypothetical protein
MSKKVFPKRSLKPNFDRPGEIYFIRGLDLITLEKSPYVKIGLVGDRKESDSAISGGDETTNDELGFEDDAQEVEASDETVDEAEVESTTYEQYTVRKSRDRLKEHQTGNPLKLVLNDALVVPSVAVSATEKAMHNLFAMKRVRGEWFFIPDDSELEEVIDQCRRFETELAAHRDVILRAAELSKFVTSESMVPSSSTTLDLAEIWREKTAEIQIMQREMAKIANLIGNDMNDVGEIDGVSTWTYRKPTKRFNQKAFQNEFEELYNLALLPTVTRGAMTVTNKPKAPVADPEMMMKFTAGLESMKNTGERTEEIQNLHLKYLTLIQESESLEWERLYVASALKVECDLSAGIQDVCKWQGKNSTRFSQPKLKEVLAAKGKMACFDKHYVDKPESFSFKLLPMRPYPI